MTFVTLLVLVMAAAMNALGCCNSSRDDACGNNKGGGGNCADDTNDNSTRGDSLIMMEVVFKVIVAKVKTAMKQVIIMARKLLMAEVLVEGLVALKITLIALIVSVVP